jgi:HJR/Mrr/RecB family endonuclease
MKLITRERMTKKTVEQEINEFVELWDAKTLVSFLECTMHLTELYSVEKDFDWVEKEVGKHQTSTIRLIRTVYLISKLADVHAGKLATIKARFKNLWQRLENIDALTAE